MELCSDEEMAALANAIKEESKTDLDAVDDLLMRFPEDPRLHFLRGSILASRQELLEAHAALVRAVELAPEFHLARYQLGFFELTSGEVDQALSTWGPLLRLPEDAYLRLFVEGLTHLVRDEFREAVTKLKSGIACNGENEALNSDIRLLADLFEGAAKGQRDEQHDSEAESEKSATSILLGQFQRSVRRN